MTIKILECVLLMAATISFLTSSYMMIVSTIEDKKRTKLEEERRNMGQERFAKELERLK